MNIYQKLSEARCELQQRAFKKSGQNKFAGYSYYELGDFLPSINELCKDKGLLPVVDFTASEARLRLFNVDKPEEVIEFTSPMGSASLKGCHEVQNIGAVETYQRRYLYMTAFEIVEHDAVDSMPKADTPKMATIDQATALEEYAVSLGGDVQAYIDKLDLKSLSYAEAEKLIQRCKGKEAKQ